MVTGQPDQFSIRLCGKNNMCDQIFYKYGLFSDRNYSFTIWTKSIIFPQNLTFKHDGLNYIVELMDIYFETYTALSPLLELNHTCGAGEHTFAFARTITL